MRGAFEDFEGRLEVGEDPSSAKATGTVQVASIDTGEPNRDGHLLNTDFFSGEEHPQITFESTSIALAADNQVTVTGDLTLMGTTNEISLTGVLGGTETDPFGNLRVGLEMHGEIDRTAFGMTFNIPLDSGAFDVRHRRRRSTSPRSAAWRGAVSRCRTRSSAHDARHPARSPHPPPPLAEAPPPAPPHALKCSASVRRHVHAARKRRHRTFRSTRTAASAPARP